jgi:hypothetical protein
MTSELSASCASRSQKQVKQDVSSCDPACQRTCVLQLMNDHHLKHKQQVIVSTCSSLALLVIRMNPSGIQAWLLNMCQGLLMD